jgi:hypothetical protein
MALLGLAASITATLGVYTVYKILNVLYKEFNSPLHNVPGPKSAHWFFGNRLQMFKHVCCFQFSAYFRLTSDFPRSKMTKKDFGLSNMGAP